MKEPEIVSSSKFASHIGLTVKRLLELEKDGVFERHSHGKWEIDICRIKYIEHLRKRIEIQGSQTEERADYEVERARLTKMKADIAEMNRDARAGQLVECQRIQKILFEIHSNFRSKVLALPGKASPKVEGKIKIAEIVEILTQEVHECLRELSNYDPKDIIRRATAEYVAAHHPNDGASADSDSEPVGGSE